MPISSQSGQGKGFAYIMYENGDDAITAYKTVDGGTFKGRLLHLLPANAPTSSNAVGTAEFDKLSLKKKRLAERKSLDPSHSFNWNSLYLNVSNPISMSLGFYLC